MSVPPASLLHHNLTSRAKRPIRKLLPGRTWWCEWRGRLQPPSGQAETHTEAARAARVGRSARVGQEGPDHGAATRDGAGRSVTLPRQLHVHAAPEAVRHEPSVL